VVRYTNRIVLLGTLAFAGAVAGHGLAYFASHPHAPQRSAVLAGTGHGSFGRLVALATGTGLVALVALALRARHHEAIRFTWLASRLVPLQVAIFAFLELAERGFDPARTAADPAVLVGLLVQVVVGLGTALLARGVESIARSIRSGSLPTPRAPARLPRPGRTSHHRSLLGRRWDARRRSPPLRLAA
jgi:hypothetical protein